MSQSGIRLWLAFVFSANLYFHATAADWPAYRMNGARTATTTETLDFPLYPAWTYVPAQRHQRAWPDEFLLRGRGKNFDAAPQAVVAGNWVYFGSTTDNTLWALNALSGKPQWGFTTSAPIRFAPAIVGDRAYVVSDDGMAYCLNATTGELIWHFHGGLSDRRLVGNGRMISRWPIRSGVAIKDGIVHFAVGMWSSEGVYVYGLDARTGKEIWCNDTNLHYLPMPHASTAHTGNMPQGYLAIGGDRVVYNNGVGGAWAYDTRTGRADGRSNGTGTLKKAKGGDYQDYGPSKFYNWSLLILDQKTGEILHHGAWEHVAEDNKLVPLHAAMAGKVLLKCVNDQVIAGDQEGQGMEIWRHTIKGASGIAVANGMLVISSSDGTIDGFRSGPGIELSREGPGTRKHPIPSIHPMAKQILTEIASRKIFKGFALVLG